MEQKKEKSKLYKVLTNIALWVFVAIIVGTILGVTAPEMAKKMDVISHYFIEIIKVFTGPIIFLTLVTGISSMGDLKKVGRIGFKALMYFEVVSIFSLAIGILIAHYFQPGSVDISKLHHGDASKYTTGPKQDISLLHLIKTNFTLQVLIVSIITGIVVNKLKFKDKVIEKFHFVEKYVFMALKLVMYLAPLAAFGGIASAVGNYGIKTLIPLGKLVGSVYATMILFILCVLWPILHFYCKVNLFKFLQHIKEELLLVWGTSSSEPALPAMMQKLEAMGCSKSVVGLVIPTGYSFNLDGTAIYLSMSVLFIAQLYNVHLSFEELGSILLILMITSKGAAGVTGSGFVVLASTLTAIHKIPLEGLGFLLGVDKFMSEARALTNVIGNGIATIVISKSEKELHLIPGKDSIAE
ncbi:cation:dicarboxylate symporter family transporter [Rhizosphaericola mali]|uniref:Cation:dicarboxylase symporter family transporter n=1 Tax=Rhizosphaericola mali TaxID=2545455 RepID=A0A5P2G2J8_9BACT|nr:cation:dicarboxylase symporter family transporter [Rhizosphaericola mali]QES87323.1 cation:dicarboxylase symporter family transporter [Rhizosphaericola mali]